MHFPASNLNGVGYTVHFVSFSFYLIYFQFSVAICQENQESPNTSITTFTANIVDAETTPTTQLPSHGDCSDSLIHPIQPIYSSSAMIRKCCPHGQNYEKTEYDAATSRCAAENIPFNVSVINATFYKDCIEDNESTELNLEFDYGNECSFSIFDTSRSSDYVNFVYSKSAGDLLYVLQNGSLLRIDENFANYDIFDEYCLDMDREDGSLTAIVCDHKMIRRQRRVLRGEAYLYSTCLLISVPCLLATAFLYFKIDEFNDLHGKSLACHSACLAFAYLLLSVAQIRAAISLYLTYLIQYFLLACLCWLSVMCSDILVKIWYSLPKGKLYTQSVLNRYFILYAVISFGVPIIPLLLAWAYGVTGIPVYYIKGLHTTNESIKSSGKYFIPPVLFLLLLCFVKLLIVSYGFYRNYPKSKAKHENHEGSGIRFEEYVKAKQVAQSTGILFLIMAVCMTIEMLTYSVASPVTTAELSPFAFFDVLIALQGVIIFIVFVCLPRPMRIIKRWWVAGGSFDVAAYAELELRQNNLQARASF